MAVQGNSLHPLNLPPNVTSLRANRDISGQKSSKGYYYLIPDYTQPATGVSAFNFLWYPYNQNWNHFNIPYLNTLIGTKFYICYYDATFDSMKPILEFNPINGNPTYSHTCDMATINHDIYKGSFWDNNQNH